MDIPRGSTLILLDAILFAFWIWGRDFEGKWWCWGSTNLCTSTCWEEETVLVIYCCLSLLCNGWDFSWMIQRPEDWNHLKARLRQEEMLQWTQITGYLVLTSWFLSQSTLYRLISLHKDIYTGLLACQYGSWLLPEWVSWQRQTQTFPFFPEPAGKADLPIWFFNFLFFVSWLIWLIVSLKPAHHREKLFSSDHFWILRLLGFRLRWRHR